MQTISLNIDEAGSFGAKWFAAQDARIRNYANSTTYTEQQKTRAERIKMVLGLLYSARNIHVNFRKTFVAIKLDMPTVRDRKGLVEMESEWANEVITKAVTKKSVVYRITR